VDRPLTRPTLLDRRDLLRLSLLGASALALGTRPARGGQVLASGEDEAGEAAADRHRLPERPAGPRSSRVAMVRSADFDSLREATRHAIALAGGLGFIRPGQTVLLKPAVNSGEPYPATTDPETVWTLAELVKEAGGEPFVADRTMFLKSTEQVFRETAIRDAAEEAGIPCRYLEDHPAVAIRHPLAQHWWGEEIRIYTPVAEADHIINLCTPRTHGLGDFTMSIKNNVGIVNGPSRLHMHVPWGFKQRVAEIGLVLRPSLIVMDGREGFGDGGPDSGDRVRPGFIAAGSDPVAIDAVGLAQLRLQGANRDIAGGSIWKIPTLERAVEIGLGVGSSREIGLVGMDPPAEQALRAQMA
jgi:uncharacterized protein (DUF362 family)